MMKAGLLPLRQLHIADVTGHFNEPLSHQIESYRIMTIEYLSNKNESYRIRFGNN